MLVVYNFLRVIVLDFIKNFFGVWDYWWVVFLFMYNNMYNLIFKGNVFVGIFLSFVLRIYVFFCE